MNDSRRSVQGSFRAALLDLFLETGVAQARAKRCADLARAPAPD